MNPSTFALRPASPADGPSIAALLASQGLPLDGVAEHLRDFVVAIDRDAIVGVAGLERVGGAALLRSVAVAPVARNRGIADALVRAVLAAAAREGVRDAYLLTTTAEAWFARRGFAPASRERVPADLAATAEFRGACPASAVLMHRLLAAG